MDLDVRWWIKRNIRNLIHTYTSPYFFYTIFSKIKIKNKKKKRKGKERKKYMVEKMEKKTSRGFHGILNEIRSFKISIKAVEKCSQKLWLI